MNLRGAATMGLAALVGMSALRQLDERRRLRRGERAPVGPVTHSLPRHEGRLAARLADWEPAPPHTTGGRIAAAAWAAPLTVVGALLALAGGSRCHWDAEHGCWTAVEVGGPSGLLLKLFGLAGNTIGQVVLFRVPRPSGLLLNHEAAHVRQAERLGPALPFVYTWLNARYGYRDNPLERAARTAAAHRPSVS
jgi:hypothetical protein